MKVNVLNCARCGQKHMDMEFKELTERRSVYKFWAMCPVKKEPILLEEYK